MLEKTSVEDSEAHLREKEGRERRVADLLREKGRLEGSVGSKGEGRGELRELEGRVRELEGIQEGLRGEVGQLTDKLREREGQLL